MTEYILIVYGIQPSSAYVFRRHTFAPYIGIRFPLGVFGIRCHRILAYVFPWAFSAYVVSEKHTRSILCYQWEYTLDNHAAAYTTNGEGSKQSIFFKEKVYTHFHEVYTPFGENINLPSVTGVYPKLLQGIHFPKKRIYAFVCRIPFRNILSRGKSILG